MMCTQNPEQSHRQEVIKAWDDQQDAQCRRQEKGKGRLPRGDRNLHSLFYILLLILALNQQRSSNVSKEVAFGIY